MANVIIDLILLAVFIIGITALNGVIGSALGTKLFNRKNANYHLEHSLHTQKGWKMVGGKK